MTMQAVYGAALAAAIFAAMMWGLGRIERAERREREEGRVAPRSSRRRAARPSFFADEFQLHWGDEPKPDGMTLEDWLDDVLGPPVQ